jgi:hypothetical protein
MDWNNFVYNKHENRTIWEIIQRHNDFTDQNTIEIMADFEFEIISSNFKCYGIYCATHCLRFNLIFICGLNKTFTS